MLTSDQLKIYRDQGHVTVPDVFEQAVIARASREIYAWSQEFLRGLTHDQAQWYLEKDSAAGRKLRKLDNPVFHNGVFRDMALHAGLLECVKQLIGEPVSVFFSQVFMKPPEVGGPKPVHQDNFYFGPNDPDATLTVWIAIDDASVENGCLYYGDGSHRRHVLQHIAPADEPFNLQIPADQLAEWAMTPAPVPSGGVSFHHGNTWHQSSANTSTRPRRAVAMHYLRTDAKLVQPALEYDDTVIVAAP